MDTSEKLLPGYAAAIVNLRSQATTDVLEIGRLLTEAKRIHARAGCKGRFKTWIERDCLLSRSTAYNMIAAHEVFGNCTTVGHFEVGALYVLSKKSTPPAALEDALKYAAESYYINQRAAKELVKKYAPEKPTDFYTPPALAELIYDCLRDVGDAQENILKALLNSGCPRNAAIFKAALRMHNDRRTIRDMLAPILSEHSPDHAAATLGVNWPCTPEALDAAYRQAAKRTHPDASGDPEQFKQVQAAYELLRELLSATAAA
ncbi:MAG: DnaJ domain-containing protein [Planctomycetota bacterium]